ncbi:glycine zipper 2TM domain-containing protein [Sphingomonas soli]|uniref:glycine zipper 2TM domain-containing protein n=1 Tax=Sphingomonas soli TaxID=266127 RepID=UPI000A02568C|nr:glycine zipper 2TM domain-containing protein [Sphingomonas soli]
MKTFTCMAAIAAATLAAATPASAQRGPGGPGYGQQDEEARFDAAQRRFDAEYQAYQAAVERYRSARARADWRDPRDDEFYDPARDYRAPPPGYRDRVLTADDRVYRGQDGKYYCKRSDGSTGLIVGAAAGGLFGNAISGGRSKTIGTLLGAIAGGALGSSVDRNQEVRCR